MLFSIQMETLAHTSPTPPVGRLLLMRSISFLFESKGHSKHKNTEPHRETGKPGGGGGQELPHSASVIHKAKYFILKKTHLIFRNVIFEIYERASERGREMSFQTSIINQKALYQNPTDQNSKRVIYYGASRIFSAARKIQTRDRKVRRLKCDADT